MRVLGKCVTKFSNLYKLQNVLKYLLNYLPSKVSVVERTRWTSKFGISNGNWSNGLSNFGKHVLCKFFIEFGRTKKFA